MVPLGHQKTRSVDYGDATRQKTDSAWGAPEATQSLSPNNPLARSYRRGLSRLGGSRWTAPEADCGARLAARTQASIRTRETLDPVPFRNRVPPILPLAAIRVHQSPLAGGEHEERHATTDSRQRDDHDDPVAPVHGPERPFGPRRPFFSHENHADTSPTRIAKYTPKRPLSDFSDECGFFATAS